MIPSTFYTCYVEETDLKSIYDDLLNYLDTNKLYTMWKT